VRDFNYAGACSQSIDEFICLCPIGRVKIRIPFIQQIDRIIGAIDDFLEHLQHSFPGRKPSFLTAIALRSVAILVLFFLVVGVKRIAWIHTLVGKLISEERVSATDIAVLVVKGGSQSFSNALAARSLPKGASWGNKQHRLDGSVVIDTVSRFKGLEAAIVILCNFEDADSRADCELFYVGLSRAKSRIYLVGSAPAIKTIRGD